MATAYTGNSIVDYLKTTGGDTSYANRANLYKSSGLNLGSYVGSATQNTSLLNYLRGAGAAPAPSSPSPSPSPSASPSSVSASMSTPRVDYVSSLTSELQAKDAEYAKVQKDAQQRLIDFYGTLEDPTTRFNRIRSEQGVDQQSELVNALTRNVMNTEDQIEGVADSVTGRSGDFVMTDADRMALTAREQDPLVKNLTKLLRSKQYEEIGLAGKNQMVSDLLELSLRGDEMRATPLKLGVDFSRADREQAMELLSSVLSTKSTAYGQDLNSFETKQAADLSFQRSKELENLSSSNSLKNSLALKSAGAASEKKDQGTEDTWNSIVGGAKTEYDVWNYINSNQDALRKAGVDVDKLWSKHSALAAKVGVGGAIRAQGSSVEDLAALLKGM